MVYKSHDSSEIENNQTDKTHCSARRKVLKTALAGGALTAAHVLPGNWIKPVVDFITLPVHAQTSPTPPPPTPACGCQISDLAVNPRTNTFSATYTWSNCSSIDVSKLVITGPGVDNLLGYVQPASGPSGSRIFTDLVPYNTTQFQLGQTYTFTLTLKDAGNSVIKTCIDTVIAAVPNN